MLQQRLANRGWLLADGAMATNLYAMGLPLGDAPELWLTQYPERIKSLHQRFIEAGADIILTNTFGCNRRRLTPQNLQDQAYPLNTLGAELARDVVTRSGRSVLVAGSVGPTGDFFTPTATQTEAEATEIFVEQMRGLKAGGADLVWIETMSAIEEMRAAARAAATVKMPYILTASFDAAGRTMSGHTPQTIAGALGTFDPKPAAIGANCGVGLSDVIAATRALTTADPTAIVVAKANCGVPTQSGNQLIYSVTSDQIRAYARQARDAGAVIIGGCCGASPDHLALMRQALDGTDDRLRLDLKHDRR